MLKAMQQDVETARLDPLGKRSAIAANLIQGQKRRYEIPAAQCAA